MPPDWNHAAQTQGFLPSTAKPVNQAVKCSDSVRQKRRLLICPLSLSCSWEVGTFLHQSAQPILNEQFSHTQEWLTADSTHNFCPQVFEFLIRRHSADSSEEEEVFPFIRTLLHFDTREFLNVLAMVRAILSAVHKDLTQLLLPQWRSWPWRLTPSQLSPVFCSSGSTVARWERVSLSLV